jgi:hypothetical protein
MLVVRRAADAKKRNVLSKNNKEERHDEMVMKRTPLEERGNGSDRQRDAGGKERASRRRNERIRKLASERKWW